MVRLVSLLIILRVAIAESTVEDFAERQARALASIIITCCWGYDDFISSAFTDARSRIAGARIISRSESRERNTLEIETELINRNFLIIKILRGIVTIPNQGLKAIPIT